ncbi:amino acid synthesis family protein [Pseudoclavibacter sp. CFCC 13796]|uniref:amino acid synthesis family protein n=1 Tax=Pseudoclavibacter sp. CFCC 13796 TaxID=2615179 RepID=UPI00130167FF|nr:amino acid synthesis family protein [Pseudoclavibacter sp. CFCC 13796]KAB1660849.1 amino acid synthesis family protein [Pseudoclavibacter sp. CFCC 13796]
MPDSPHVETVDLTTRSTLSDYARLAEKIRLRRLDTICDEIYVAGADSGIHQAAALAVIANPWLGTPTDRNLQPETIEIAPILAKLLSDRLLDRLGGADQIEAFGKSAAVGTAGEYEHGAALIHTPYFGNLLREALGGTSIIVFSDTQTGPTTHINVPMWHKTHASTRSHYQSLETPLVDAPHPEEIVIIAAASTGPRPHARIGDRSTDQPVTSEVLKTITL